MDLRDGDDELDGLRDDELDVRGMVNDWGSVVRPVVSCHQPSFPTRRGDDDQIMII